jgi:hypothetical protein
LYPVGEEDNREVKDDPLNSRSPEGRDKGENENREYESSCEESVGEKNKMDKRDTGESIEEEEKGVEVNIGNCVTEEEEDGTVTVLKLSNGVMFRVPVEVQGMQLQAVVDTAAQVTLVSEEFYKSLDPAPPIRKEVVMNTAGKGMQMNGYIAGPFQVVLGTHLFTVEIYVAPIEEDMLLGLDFLEANGVSLHLNEKELQIDLLYSDSLYVRTHLFCIGQNFPLLYFYIVIGCVNQTKHWVITPIVQCSRY